MVLRRYWTARKTYCPIGTKPTFSNVRPSRTKNVVPSSQIRTDTRGKKPAGRHPPRNPFRPYVLRYKRRGTGWVLTIVVAVVTRSKTRTVDTVSGGVSRCRRYRCRIRTQTVRRNFFAAVADWKHSVKIDKVATKKNVRPTDYRIGERAIVEKTETSSRRKENGRFIDLRRGRESRLSNENCAAPSADARARRADVRATHGRGKNNRAEGALAKQLLSPGLEGRSMRRTPTTWLVYFENKLLLIPTAVSPKTKDVVFNRV